MSSDGRRRRGRSLGRPQLEAGARVHALPPCVRERVRARQRRLAPAGDGNVRCVEALEQSKHDVDAAGAVRLAGSGDGDPDELHARRREEERQGDEVVARDVGVDEERAGGRDRAASVVVAAAVPASGCSRRGGGDIVSGTGLRRRARGDRERDEEGRRPRSRAMASAPPSRSGRRSSRRDLARLGCPDVHRGQDRLDQLHSASIPGRRRKSRPAPEHDDGDQAGLGICEDGRHPLAERAPGSRAGTRSCQRTSARPRPARSRTRRLACRFALNHAARPSREAMSAPDPAGLWYTQQADVVPVSIRGFANVSENADPVGVIVAGLPLARGRGKQGPAVGHAEREPVHRGGVRASIR